MKYTSVPGVDCWGAGLMRSGNPFSNSLDFGIHYSDLEQRLFSTGPKPFQEVTGPGFFCLYQRCHRGKSDKGFLQTDLKSRKKQADTVDDMDDTVTWMVCVLYLNQIVEFVGVNTSTSVHR
ncbi:hypothetical protein CB1_001984008 [Camelus ferus]|nr:hypothetical protein CB1_001984008 [Camelus ferus]